MLITEAFTWGRFRRKMWSGHSLKCTWKSCLSHWGQVMYKCIRKLTIIGSDNGLSPGQRQAIIWLNAGILLIRPLRTNFSEILNRISYIFIQENAFEKVIWKRGAILYRPQCVNTAAIISCGQWITALRDPLFYVSMFTIPQVFMIDVRITFFVIVKPHLPPFPKLFC